MQSSNLGGCRERRIPAASMRRRALRRHSAATRSSLALAALMLLALAGVATAIADDRASDSAPAAASTEWVEIDRFAAPEAHQAAAADQRFVYAIASRQIARYDRRTHQRLGVSQGEAQHLNSGFLRDGRLYCAHSNYPQVPERSEILVLDPDSLRLTTFKEFGNRGGSLTWVVHDGTHWWCNFARYGADNAQTFVERFDDQWQPRGRWTYPEAVIRELGRHSLSGGVWRDGMLWVTGHDDPVIFRLRLPREGKVLELVDKIGVPFTGQGIAHDPKTGGFVGIDRSKKQLVFAISPEAAKEHARDEAGKSRTADEAAAARSQDESASQAPRLRVLSYNIHHGEGLDGRLDLPRIARVIRGVSPDVVALQEVDRKAQRTGSVDQPAELARLTEMQVVFGANLPLEGGEYGNAVLTRLPVIADRNHALPRTDGEPRGVLEVRLRWPTERSEVVVLATHLDHRRDDRERLASIDAISRIVDGMGERPALLVGDLNDTPKSEVMARAAKQWRTATPDPLPTIPSARPTRQIDYVLFRPAGSWRVVEARVLDEPVASDHRPLLVELEWRAE